MPHAFASRVCPLAEAKNVAAAARIKLAEDAVKIKAQAEEKAHSAYNEMRAEAQAMARAAEQASAATKEQAAQEKAAAVAVAKAAEAEAAKAHDAAKRAEKERVEAERKAQIEVRRIRAEAAQSDPVAPPATWTTAGKIPPDFANDGGTHGDRRFRKTAPVREGTAEHIEVVRSFEKTSEGFKVVKVERVQNVALYQSYMMWLLNMRHREEERAQLGQEAVPLDRIEAPLWLWHGCPLDIVPKIISRGFNRSFAGANATLYGKGVYFALGASLLPPAIARPAAALPCTVLVLATSALLTHPPPLSARSLLQSRGTRRTMRSRVRMAYVRSLRAASPPAQSSKVWRTSECPARSATGRPTPMAPEQTRPGGWSRTRRYAIRQPTYSTTRALGCTRPTLTDGSRTMTIRPTPSTLSRSRRVRSD